MSLVSSSDEKNEAQRVRNVVLEIYRAFEKLDAEMLDRNFEHSRELLAFGTDQDEKFDGWDSYKDVHKVQFAAVKSFTFTARELEVHIQGDVAWVADRPHWRVETKTGEKVDRDMRITSVLRKEAESNEWRVVQWHVSAGLEKRLHEY